MIRFSSFIPPIAYELFDEINKVYRLKYVGVYKFEEGKRIYIQFENRISLFNTQTLLINMGIGTEHVSVCTKFDGDEMLTERGSRPKIGGSSKRKRRSSSTIINNNDHSTTINNDNSTTNNSVNLIFVNPIGQESLEHITPEFIQNLLSEHHGPDVVFRFGTKMYSLQENMNFKTDIKSGYITGRCEQDGAWTTHRKNDGFEMLLDNLKLKNEEAVLSCLEGIPEEDFEKFKSDMHWIREHKTSGLQEDVPTYQRFIRDGFNLLSANIADKKRRIERDCGKKLKLV